MWRKAERSVSEELIGVFGPCCSTTDTFLWYVTTLFISVDREYPPLLPPPPLLPSFSPPLLLSSSSPLLLSPSPPLLPSFSPPLLPSPSPLLPSPFPPLLSSPLLSFPPFPPLLPSPLLSFPPFPPLLPSFSPPFLPSFSPPLPSPLTQGLLYEAELGLSLPFSIDHRILVVMLQTSPYARHAFSPPPSSLSL